MRSHRSPLAAASLVFTVQFALLQSAAAQDLQPQPLMCGGGLFGQSDAAEANANVSGVDCLPAGAAGQWTCAAVADEGVSVTGLTITRASDGSYSCLPGGALKYPAAYGCLPQTGKVERDLEGVSLAADNISAVSSLGMSRKKGEFRPNNWSLLIKPLSGPAQACSSYGRDELLPLFQKILGGLASQAIDRTLQCGGLNIEGFERDGDRLFFGLRSPAARAAGEAFIIETTLRAVQSAGAEEIGASHLHRMVFRDAGGQPVQGIGIRGLDIAGDRLIILTGQAGVDGSDKALEVSNASEFGCPGEMAADPPYPNREVSGIGPALWIWTPGDADAKPLGAFSGAYGNAKNGKVEGLTVLPIDDTTADLVLAIDAPVAPLSQLAIVRGVKLK